MKKCILFFLTLMLLCNILSGCAVYHKLTEEEKQELSIEVQEYFSTFPALLGDYIAEDSWDELYICNPQGQVHPISSDDIYGVMFENCSLNLKKGEHLIIRYSLAKDSKIMDHALIYTSEKFPCNTVEEAIVEMNHHKPNFGEIEWLEEVGKDFYPPDTDISAEWDSVYEEVLYEINPNGLMEHESYYTWGMSKKIYTKTPEYYAFGMGIRYDKLSNCWYYEYMTTLQSPRY